VSDRNQRSLDKNGQLACFIGCAMRIRK